MRIILIGSSGAMGRKVISAAIQRGHEIVAGVDRINSDDSFPVFEKVADINADADMVIDFSHPHLLLDVLKYCEENSLPLVSATTGIGEDDEDTVFELSRKVPVARSKNFSFGISVMKVLLEKAVKLLSQDYDIEIVEMHHNKKIDAPSGTAEMLYDVIEANSKRTTYPVYGRHERHEKRDRNEVGIVSLRGGTVVGEHEVIFAGEDETIKISHSACSKEVFAQGALIAAETIIGKENGYYTMDQIADIMMEDI